ncbi:MAG: ankyrin repeat domain-containing protein [Prosthecobacter sp.]|uniref:ankyrin repeat domain-containing protein n=1 Tax=Prosthecobacter sp. TaxID=1965333 RepID=UPI003BAF3EF2
MENSCDDLHWAAERGDISAVKAFLAAGHDPNAFDDLSFTPLHYAAREGHLHIIRLLLEAGADVNAHDEPRFGNTPLGDIAGNCSLAVAQALLAAGADPTVRGWMQLCALDRAKDRKRDDGPKVYELLCNASRKFNVA